jgi:hypothetical protein
MPANSFGKYVIPAALSTGALFSALMTPLLMFSDQQVTVSSGDTALVDLKLKDVATPYAGIVGLISLGFGASSVAATGLRNSARRAAQENETLLNRQRQLEAREISLQQALTSENFLDRSGLSFFLEDEVSPSKMPVLHSTSLTPSAMLAATPPSSVAVAPAAPVSVVPIPAPVAVAPALQWISVAPAPQPVATPVAQPVAAAPVAPMAPRFEMAHSVMAFVQPTPASRPVQSAAPTFSVAVPVAAEPAWVPAARPVMQSMVTPWPAAQGFLSFARPGAAPAEADWNAPMTAQDQASIAQIHALQFQLQQIVSQIESLQTNLQPEPALQIFETVSYPEAPLPVRAHRGEWVVQRVAS